MNSTDSLGVPQNMVVFTGPLLLGHLFNWGLYGVLCLQVYLYYVSFPNDRWMPKAVVVTVALLETIQLVLATRDAFRVFGSGWGNLSQWDVIGWQWFSVPAFVVIIGSIAQVFYAWRIYILGGKFWVPIIVVVLSILQFVSGMWGAIISRKYGRYSLLQDHASKPTGVWLASTALCDIVIAASMFWYIKRPNNRMRATSAILSRILRATVETGLICAVIAISDFILFMIFRYNNIHVPLCSSLTKLYSNSLLAVLNARIQINGARNGIDMSVEVPLSAMTDSNVLSTIPGSRTFSVLSDKFRPMSLTPGKASSTITYDGTTDVDSVTVV